MPYMTAKHYQKSGSIALKRTDKNTEEGAYYMQELALKYLDEGIQILTVSDFNIYAEYKPITYVKNRADFEQHIISDLLD